MYFRNIFIFSLLILIASPTYSWGFFAFKRKPKVVNGFSVKKVYRLKDDIIAKKRGIVWVLVPSAADLNAQDNQRMIRLKANTVFKITKIRSRDTITNGFKYTAVAKIMSRPGKKRKWRLRNQYDAFTKNSNQPIIKMKANSGSLSFNFTGLRKNFELLR
jgi:hypothetical protein